MPMVEVARREILLTPQEPQEPAPPSVWEQWLPVLSSVMTMAMLGAMVQALKPGKK